MLHSTSINFAGQGDFAQRRTQLPPMNGVGILHSTIREITMDSFLVKENHQPGWWFQKASALPRKKYPSEAGNNQ